jgi:heme/copper-type cytochrome/quinol oxidase subunit 3
MSSTNVALMLASLGPVWWTARAARRLDILRTRVGLALCSICGVGFLLFRWFEFLNLNTPWRASGYGSAVWATLAFHTSLLVVQAAEAIGLTAILLRRPPRVRYLPAVVDFALYWTFLVLLWLPFYLMIDVAPRFGR